MIFITGDIHGDPTRFSINNFPEQKEITRDDFVIICGDFGLIWAQEESKREKYWLDWLEDKPYTTLFVDGNHENFARLNACPVENWHGGKVHKIREHVIHLMRGEVFDISDKKIFTFGGARSHDINGLATKEELDENYTAGILNRHDPQFDEKYKKLFKSGLFTRIEGESWWADEMSTKDEMKHGLHNLEKNGLNVDFIVSHDGPASDLILLGGRLLKIDPLNQYLEDVRQKTTYRKWFFGHHHMNHQINEKDIVLYEQIIRIA